MRTDWGADLLRSARCSAGLTQQTLAARAGIPQSVLSAYERGRRNPSLAAAARILEAAGFRVALEHRIDEARSGRVLCDLLALADALPKRERGALAYPRLP